MASRSSRYIQFPITVDPQDLMQNVFTYLKAKIPGWTPQEGQLDVWLTEAFAQEAADVAILASEFPKAAFRYFGATLFGLQPVDSAAASVATTWTLQDNAGHTIAAGTQVGVRDITGALIPFRVLLDVIVPAGATTTSAGQVILVAINSGAAASGLGSIGGTMELIDPISWVSSIVMTTATSGGVDAESDDDYLSRLAVELQTMSPRPIVPNDFAILARNIAGVQRAVAVDGYNPADATYNNMRMVTVVSVDAAGLGVGVVTKAAVKAYLQSLREINFVVNTTDPQYTAADVTVQFKRRAGYSVADAQAFVVAALTNYLSPAMWGITPSGDNPNNPITWNNQSIVAYLEIATLINNTPGVDSIQLLTMGANGGAQAAQDLNLTGVVPLPTVGTLVVTPS